jgi:hypothetical protein
MPRPKALPRILAEIPAASPILDGLQSEKQAAFVAAYAVTGVNGVQAAKLAGYSSPGSDAYRLLSLPHVRAAIRAQRETAIHGDLAKMALETLAQLMTSETTPAAVRLGASRTALEMAGHLGKAPELSANEKNISEMSVAELQRFIAAGEDALASVKIAPGRVLSAQDSAPNVPSAQGLAE